MNRILNMFRNQERNQRSYLDIDAWKYLGSGLLLMFMIGVASVYLSPLLYMGSTSLKSQKQLADPDDHPLIPRSPETYLTTEREFMTSEIEGRVRSPEAIEYGGQHLLVYELTFPVREDGEYVLLNQTAQTITYLNLADPEAGPVTFSVDDIATQSPALEPIDAGLSVVGLEKWFRYEGQEYPIFNVEFAVREDGDYALLERGTSTATYLNVDDLEAAPLVLMENDIIEESLNTTRSAFQGLNPYLVDVDGELRPVGLFDIDNDTLVVRGIDLEAFVVVEQHADQLANPIPAASQFTVPDLNGLNLYQINVDGVDTTVGLLTITEDDVLKWLDFETFSIIEQPVSELPNATPTMTDVIKTANYNYDGPLLYEYEGQEYEVVLAPYPDPPRKSRFALLEDRGDSGLFIDIRATDAEPVELGPDELLVPVGRLERVRFFVSQVVPIYKVETPEGETKEYGFVVDEGQEDVAPEERTGLWIDLEQPNAPPFDLEISVADLEYAYVEEDFDLYKVPMPDGDERQLALLNQKQDLALFIDPETDEPLVVQTRTRGLERFWQFEWHPDNFREATDYADFNFFRLFRNTMLMSVIGGFGAMASATLVAYGFTRFNVPYANVLFIILLSTIMLPPQVTQIPTFIVYQEFGWIGTLLPLIVPHFFSNAYNVFLLRQYMMGIPRELDDAARVDGANPFQILWHVIIPSSIPALVAVYLFHFLFSWNDFQQPLIYISGNNENQVLAVGLQKFTQIYSGNPELMMAAGIMTMAVPLLIFFFAQRIFMQGVVITGVEK
ncbi:MAG: carbohydrate ABC transporter permease [Chloroflexi bacterium]|nr:carbohydrate ABC transporter permease [Chloroflexota bacterium]